MLLRWRHITLISARAAGLMNSISILARQCRIPRHAILIAKMPIWSRLKLFRIALHLFLRGERNRTFLVDGKSHWLVRVAIDMPAGAGPTRSFPFGAELTFVIHRPFAGVTEHTRSKGAHCAISLIVSAYTGAVVRDAAAGRIDRCRLQLIRRNQGEPIGFKFIKVGTSARNAAR